MNKDYSTIINLCDRFQNSLSRYSTVCSKVQIGSYTCFNYFKYLLNILYDKKISFAQYDLVIPTFPESELNFMGNKKFISAIQNANKIVVNDFGMLQFYSKNNIRLGRLIFKDYRDGRYVEYDRSSQKIKIDGIIDSLADIGYKLDEIEIDLISAKMGVLPKSQIKIYAHYPYRQISCSHICEFSSIGKDIKDKFIPDDLCTMECENIRINTFNPFYLKIGKSVYDIIDETYLENLNDKVMIIKTPRW